jgi:hypothetical protein
LRATIAAGIFVLHQPILSVRQISHRAHLPTNVVKVDAAHLANALVSQINNGVSITDLQIRCVVLTCAVQMGDANASLKGTRVL